MFPLLPFVIMFAKVAKKNKKTKFSTNFFMGKLHF